jgi:hypothetical protein
LSAIRVNAVGGAVVDGAFVPGAIPYAAAVLPLAALPFILSQERASRAAGLAQSPRLAEGS